MCNITNDDKLISTNHALKSVNDLIQWMEENEENVEFSHLLTLHSLRSKLIEIKVKKKLEQSKITTYFKPKL